MLDHMHPEKPGGKNVYRRGISRKGKKERRQEEDTPPEPPAPQESTGMQADQRGGSSGSGSVVCQFLPGERHPAANIQDFSENTSEQQGGRNRPPICIDPDIHSG